MAQGHTRDYFASQWKDVLGSAASLRAQVGEDETQQSAAQSKEGKEAAEEARGAREREREPAAGAGAGAAGAQAQASSSSRNSSKGHKPKAEPGAGLAAGFLSRGTSRSNPRPKAAAPVLEDGKLSAAGEKERGNELFRQGRYEEAMRCYSHSLALEPTAVAWANRAMAFLKLGRYEEAESDCSEALLRDDEYVKALCRRATARLRLKKPIDALQDIETALKLEPGSKELASLKAEALKSGGAQGWTGVSSETPAETLNGPNTAAVGPVHSNQIRLSAAPVSTPAPVLEGVADHRAHPLVHAVPEEHLGNDSGTSNSAHVDDVAMADSVSASVPGDAGVQARVESLAAASLRVLERERAQSNCSAGAWREPRSARDFEAAWRALSSSSAVGDGEGGQREAGGGESGGAEGNGGEMVAPGSLEKQRKEKLRYLKLFPPDKLPGLLEDSLTGPLLFDILITVLEPKLFGPDSEAEGRAWACQLLTALSRAPRFVIAALCLAPAQRTELSHAWSAAGAFEPSLALPLGTPELLTQMANALRLMPL